MNDKIIKLCNKIAKSDFEPTQFYFERNGDYGMLSVLNKWNTSLLKIEFDDLKGLKYQTGILTVDELFEGNCQFRKVEYDEDLSTTLLDKFEKEMFDDKGYLAYDYQMFVRKLNCKYNEKGEVLVYVDENEAIYSTYFLKSVLLLDDGFESLIHFKLNAHDTPLYLKYDLDDVIVFAIVAPKITAHYACNIVQVR